MASIHTPPQTKHKKQDFSPGYVALMTTSPANRVISSRRIIVWLARRTIRHLHYQWCYNWPPPLSSVFGWCCHKPSLETSNDITSMTPFLSTPLPPQTPPAKTSQNIFRTLPQTIADIKISVKKWTGICMHNFTVPKNWIFLLKKKKFSKHKILGLLIFREWFDQSVVIPP